MDLKKVIFMLKNIDLGAKFSNNFKCGPKNNPFRIIKMGHVSEDSAAHPTKTLGIRIAPAPPPPPRRQHKCNTIPAYIKIWKRPPFMFWYVDHLSYIIPNESESKMKAFRALSINTRSLISLTFYLYYQDIWRKVY